MRLLFLLLAAFAGTGLPIPSATCAESTNTVKIESISHAIETEGAEAKESLTFQLSGPAVPKVFTMKGDNPRLVIDFPGSVYSGKNVIPLPGGKLATTIRTGLHQTPEQKTRVAVDLAKEIAVRYTREYSEADNTLRVELTPDSTGQPQKIAGPVSQPRSLKGQPSVEIPTAKPPAEKPFAPVPPTIATNEKKPAAEKPPAAAATPQLLDISFDDSSNKGEMVLFHLNDFYPPTVSAVEKDNPRVLCDFMAMGLGKGIQENILANGKFVKSIHTATHKNPDKVQVILNLTPDRDYDLQQVFFKNDNLFVLIVNELLPESAGK